MNRTLRFLLTVVLSLVLVLGQGVTAFASKNGSCCQQSQVESSHSCCEKTDRLIVQPRKVFSSQAQLCVCNINDLLALSPEFRTESLLKAICVSSGSPVPTQNLQLTAAGHPIWLYKLFYPDGSRLYQQKNSWLL